MTIRLGLTGGIGSGKSTAAGMFASLGAAVIDADAVSRRTTAAGGAAMAGIFDRFGSSFVAPDGSLNRDAMRRLIFSEPSAKDQLEAIIHPLVGLEIHRLEQQAVASGSRLIIFDIPLLVESTHWRSILDLVLIVDCEPETQIHRVMQRSGWQREQVLQVLAAQIGRSQRLAAADMVIFNQSIDIPALLLVVQQCMQQLGLSSSYDCG